MALTLFKHREGEREIKNVFTPGWIVAKLHVSKPLVVERHLTENVTKQDYSFQLPQIILH